MRIIFLDIDGVLNSASGHYGVPDTDKLLRLQHIIKETGAKVVLSSSWRIGKDGSAGKKTQEQYFDLVDLLAKYDAEVIDTTPEIYKGRGNEIDTWLKETEYEVDSFVILDDDIDLEPHLDRLVHTDYYVGMQDIEAEEAIDLLLGKRDVSQYYLDKDFIALI